MQPKKDPKDEKEQLSDEEVAQETKTFIGVNNPKISQQAIKKEDLEYLQSGSTWDAIGVNAELALRLAQLGFKRPSLIQFKVVKLSAQNSVVAQSQNGSGKTLAYLVPILNRIKEFKPSPEGQPPAPQVIILADTKALILQVATLLKRICEGYSTVKIDYVFGGKTDIQPGTSVLVSTIVQVKNLLAKKAFSPNAIDFLVVDEADSVFDADFNRAYFQTLISKLLKTDKFKAIFTSATMTDNFRKVIQSFQEKRNLILIELPVEKLTLANVTQYQIECTDFANKVQTLFKLMEAVQAQNILIFDNKKRDLGELEKILTAKGFKAAFIYKADERDGSGVNAADYLQEKIQDFLAGKYRILLTTNLLSRGIDMRKVTLVVNLSLPFKMRESEGILDKKVDLETYLHRVGRTGRFGDHGIAVNFINNQEEMGMMREIQDFYKNKVESIRADNLKDLDDKLQQIQNLNKEKRDLLEENI